jgi:hypothetical protein
MLLGSACRYFVLPTARYRRRFWSTSDAFSALREASAQAFHDALTICLKVMLSLKLTDLLHTTHLGYSILSARRLSHLDITAEIRTELDVNMKSIELGNREALQALEEAFARGKRGAMPPSQLTIFQPIGRPLSRFGRIIFPACCTFPTRYAFLEQSSFCSLRRELLNKCVDQLRGLELEAYSGDYVLRLLRYTSSRSSGGVRCWTMLPGASAAPQKQACLD